MADRVGFRVALRVWGSTVENLEVAVEAHPARAGIDRAVGRVLSSGMSDPARVGIDRH